MNFRIASNALANIVNGATSAAFQMAMTAIISRGSSAKTELAVWSLAASVSAIAPLLSVNLAAAAVRRMAAISTVDRSGLAAVFVATGAIATRLLVCALVLSTLIVFLAPLFYPTILGPHPSAIGFSVGVFFLGACWVVSAQTAQSVLMMEGRNWSITMAGFVARLMAIAFVAIVLLSNRATISIALIGAGICLWTGWWLMSRFASDGQPNASFDSYQVKAERQEICSVIAGYATWSFASTAIQAATVPIVGLIDPSASVPVFIAFTLVGVIAGLGIAASSAVIAPLARLLNASDPSSNAGRISTLLTTLVWVLINFGLIAVFFLMEPLLVAWVPAQIGAKEQISTYFVLLSLQHGLRSIAVIPSIVVAMTASRLTITRAALPETFMFFLLALPIATAFGVDAFLIALSFCGACGVWVVALEAHRTLSGISRSKRVDKMFVILLFAATFLVWTSLGRTI
jgi:hypothetical protein